MRKILATMMALALTIGAQGQQDDGLDAMMAAMIAAKIHQDSIDTSSLVAVYDYECQTQDADGKAVTDRMKVCPQVVQMLSLKDIASFLNITPIYLSKLRKEMTYETRAEGKRACTMPRKKE